MFLCISGGTKGPKTGSKSDPEWIQKVDQKCAGNEEAILCFEQVSGKGSVFTHTLIRDTRMKGFENIMPYPVVLVELAEQPRLIHYANMPTTNLEDIRIGRPVEVMFIEIGEGFTLPDFRLATN